MIFTSISYLLFLPLIVVAYYLLPGRKTPPPGHVKDLTPNPSPEGEGSAATRIEKGGSYQWICLVLASVAYYLSFIPVFFALIGVLVIGNYFGGRWLFRANERGNGKEALTTLVEIKRKNIEPEHHFGYFSLYLLFFPRIALGRKHAACKSGKLCIFTY